jgi:hypothetical protein
MPICPVNPITAATRGLCPFCRGQRQVPSLLAARRIITRLGQAWLANGVGQGPTPSVRSLAETTRPDWWTDAERAGEQRESLAAGISRQTEVKLAVVTCPQKVRPPCGVGSLFLARTRGITA